jgi:dephospho-CoA kinase
MTVLLGLTGSIGMGKSTVARMFAAEGAPVFDADAEVHRLQAPEGALVAAIEAAFPGTTGPDGVDRSTLAERVLAAPAALKQLEALIHPAVGAARDAFLAAHPAAPVVVLDIPLLFEKGLDAGVDKVAVVSADAEIQRIRTLARPGMTPEKFLRILSYQLPDAEKRARADFVIPTDSSLEETRASVRNILACLGAPADS